VKTESRTFGEVELTSTQLGAARALTLLCKLLKTDYSRVGQIDRLAILASVPSEQLLPLIVESFASTTAVFQGAVLDLGSAQSINLVFSGRTKLLIDAWFFALEVTFADFFDESPGRGAPGPAQGDESSSD
jgi:hypothetical protein